MIPVDVEALIVADAIGALDAHEREALEGHLRALTPTERRQVAELYDVAVVIAESVTQIDPPSRVRARLLHSPKHDVHATTALNWDAVGQGGLIPPLQHGVLRKAP